MQKFDEIRRNDTLCCLEDTYTSTQLVEAFEKKNVELTNSTFPFKKVILSEDDKPHFTEELRLLKRQRQRIYRREGRSHRYKEKKKEFKEKERIEACKYKEKVNQEVLLGERISAYQAIRRF